MLVLTRTKNESVQVELDGREVTVKILGVDGGKVRIGFEAPEEVRILRTEIIDRDE
jgi:carbon storage regulator